MENKMGFERCYTTSPIILMEGALGERLKREYDIPYDEIVGLAGHIYNEKAKTALEELFSQYIKISIQYNFPMMITTPTRRANKERISQSKFNQSIIDDNVSFLNELKNKFCSDV